MKTINIAIDGPAGAGKSTIAKMVSAKLGYIYVDTGALYRAVALYITENNIADEDIEKALAGADVSLRFVDGAQRVFLGDRDVSDLIRNTYSKYTKVFGSVIPRSVRAAETSAEGKSIFLHDPNGKVAKAYENLAKEVLDDGRAQRVKNRADRVR